MVCRGGDAREPSSDVSSEKADATASIHLVLQGELAAVAKKTQELPDWLSTRSRIAHIASIIIDVIVESNARTCDAFEVK